MEVVVAAVVEAVVVEHPVEVAVVAEVVSVVAVEVVSVANPALAVRNLCPNGRNKCSFDLSSLMGCVLC